jgi:hypothetical protein
MQGPSDRNVFSFSSRKAICRGLKKQGLGVLKEEAQSRWPFKGEIKDLPPSVFLGFHLYQVVSGSLLQKGSYTEMISTKGLSLDYVLCAGN